MLGDRDNLPIDATGAGGSGDPHNAEPPAYPCGRAGGGGVGGGLLGVEQYHLVRLIRTLSNVGVIIRQKAKVSNLANLAHSLDAR